MKQFFVTLFALLQIAVLITPVFAQQGITVTGRITDDTGEPLPSVNVVVKGTTLGMVSNMDGTYSLVVPGRESILSFSFIGYEPQEIPVGSRTSINVIMKENTQMIDEVVVVGYGSVKRRDIVGSVTKLGGDELTKLPVTSIAQSLQGMSSGMMVSNPSGHPGRAPEIKIRGLNSINLSTDPLWIVDGMPIHTGAGEMEVMGTKGVSAIAMLNPDDIESIQVLKDAAATAIYGSRGSGGVILITTKSNKGDKTGVNVSYEGGVSQIPFNYFDIFMDSKTWWEYMDLQADNSGGTRTNPGECMNIQFQGVRPVMSKEDAINTNTDHLKALTQKAWFHQVGFTANKSFDTGGVMFSLNYRSEEGLIRNNDLDRLTTRLSFNFKPLRSVEMGVNSNFIYLKKNGVNEGQGKQGAGWGNFSSALPWYKIYDEDSQTGYWAGYTGYNLRASTDRNYVRNDVDEYRNLNHAFIQWNTPLKGLFIRGEVGVDLLVNNSSYWRSALLVATQPFISTAYEQSITSAKTNYNAYANYNRSFDNHNVDITAGWEASRDWEYKRSAKGQELQTIYPELINPLTMLEMEGRRGGNSFLMGFFARVNYKFMDKYLLNVSARRDGHSAFSKDNRWANFYAAGAGWIISDEGFMEGISWLNFLKLRGSYGITGNTAVKNDMTYMKWDIERNGVWGVDYLSGNTKVGPLGSNSLKWETTANLDLGFDFGLFNNRINGSFAYYTQNISDLILRGNVQPSVGYFENQIYENIGDLKNWGYEFNISSVNIRNRDFTWKTDFNISTNKNKIITLNETEKGKGLEDTHEIRKEGEALNTWYTCNMVGVDPEKGIYMIEQRDADIWNTEYRTVATGKIIPATTNNVSVNKMIQHGKTKLPTFYGGFNNTFFLRVLT